MTLPLTGIRVLDFSRYLPGAYFGWIAGDMGADVIRIEHPRELAKHERMFGAPDDEAAARLRRARPSYDRNKRSLVVNPGHPKAAALLRRLIERSDVLVEDYRPGTMGAMGLSYEAVSTINPRIVYASVSFAGQTGPLAGRAGHDPAALAASGVLSRLAGVPVPMLPGVQVADVMAGTHATIAVLLALQARDRSGTGTHVDVAMIDASMPLTMVALARAEDPEAVRPPDGRWNPKGGVWRCADGQYVCTTDMEPRYWARFCAAIDRPDWVALQFRPETHPAIHADLERLFATRSRAEWMTLLGEADTQAMPVLSPAEALRHPHAEARGMRVVVPVDGAGEVEQIGTPFRIAGIPSRPHRAAGMPGAERDGILTELGLSDEEISHLEAAGVFSSTSGAA